MCSDRLVLQNVMIQDCFAVGEKEYLRTRGVHSNSEEKYRVENFSGSSFD